MLLLSTGGIIKEKLYANLPLLQFIATNGEFRVFTLFSFIIVASFPFSAWIIDGGDLGNMVDIGDTGPTDWKGRRGSPLFRRILLAFSVICIVVILWTILHPAGSVLLHATSASPGSGLTDKIKWWIERLSFYDRLLIDASLLLCFLLAYFLLEKRIPRAKLLPGMILADLLLFCWLHLPVTGVQQRSPASITRSYLSSVRPGIPIPLLLPIGENTREHDDFGSVLGCWSYYDKQPGTPELCDYPTMFTGASAYFRSPLSVWMDRRPFIFLKKDSARALAITEYSADEMKIALAPGTALTPGDRDTLVLLQNYYPYWTAAVDARPVPIHKEYGAFIGIPLENGASTVQFNFRPLRLWWPVLIALLALAAGIFFSVRERSHQRRNEGLPAAPYQG